MYSKNSGAIGGLHSNKIVTVGMVKFVEKDHRTVADPKFAIKAVSFHGKKAPQKRKRMGMF
jgi:hypothetical protein